MAAPDRTGPVLLPNQSDSVPAKRKQSLTIAGKVKWGPHFAVKSTRYSK